MEGIATTVEFGNSAHNLFSLMTLSIYILLPTFLSKMLLIFFLNCKEYFVFLFQFGNELYNLVLYLDAFAQIAFILPTIRIHPNSNSSLITFQPTQYSAVAETSRHLLRRPNARVWAVVWCHKETCTSSKCVQFLQWAVKCHQTQISYILPMNQQGFVGIWPNPKLVLHGDNLLLVSAGFETGP